MAYRRGGSSNVFCGSEIRASQCIVTDLIKSPNGLVAFNAPEGLKVNGKPVTLKEPQLVAEIYSTDKATIPAGSRGISLPILHARRLMGDIEMTYEEKKGIWLGNAGIYELSSILQFGAAEGGGKLSSYFDYTGDPWKKYGYDTCSIDEKEPGVRKNSCILEYTDTDEYVSLKISNSCTNNVDLNTDGTIGWRWTVKYLGKLKRTVTSDETETEPVKEKQNV